MHLVCMAFALISSWRARPIATTVHSSLQRCRPPTASAVHTRDDESRLALLSQWAALAHETGRRAPQTAEVIDDEPLRIGRFAGEAFALGSTTQGIRAAKQHRLLVNGRPAHSHSALVSSGDVVTLLPAEGPAPPAPEPVLRFVRALEEAGLRALYEDDEVAVVFKPSGPHSKPYRGAPCVEAALPALLSPSGAADALPRPVAVHRLDSLVSGCLLVAKTRGAAAQLAASFRSRGVYKRYRALALGRVEGPRRPLSRELDAPLDGRAALTRLSVVSYTPHVQAGYLTTLDLEPVTGRRHQLRRHLAALGHPLVGDDLHDGGGTLLRASSALMLQSVEVRVRHPTRDGAWVHACVPEARKFGRQRERSWDGFHWACEQGRHGQSSSS